SISSTVEPPNVAARREILKRTRTVRNRHAGGRGIPNADFICRLGGSMVQWIRESRDNGGRQGFSCKAQTYRNAGDAIVANELPCVRNRRFKPFANLFKKAGLGCFARRPARSMRHVF